MYNYTIIDEWYSVYRHIAERLHDFYKNHTTSPSVELYERLKDSEFALLNKGRLFRDRLSRISDFGLDPIQVFATFNYSKIGDRRVEIINALLTELGSDIHIDRGMSFEGCPSPVITQIIQYRGPDVQNQIWEMFDAVMKKGIDGLANKHFSALAKWRGLDIASLTMFLFWIDSEEFIPLDRNTVTLLRTFDIIAERPRTYNEYRRLCTTKLSLSPDKSADADVIRNFVKDAYRYTSEEPIGSILSNSTAAIVSKNKYKKETKDELEDIAKRMRQERINGIKIIALRPRKSPRKTEQLHLKNLEPDRLYRFYQFYQFNPMNDDTIVYDEGKDVDLYSLENLKISISSIVGKNGSGKSTIAEFLYLVINKIAVVKKIKSTEKLIDEEVFADLFIKLDKLYKVSVSPLVEIFEYNLDNDNKTYRISKEKIEIEAFDIEQFCYTIAVNYSLYSLNTNITGDWIYPLFHKNDSYQTPIVLNPLRDEGNIDVNNEEGLAKSRMLSNILEPGLIDFEKKIVPELIPNSIPINLVLEFDEGKIDRKKTEFKIKYKRIHQKQINRIIEALDVADTHDLEFVKETREYIYLKAVTISDRYSKFRKFNRLPDWISSNPQKLQEYIAKLLDDTSHITFKLRQAISYLRYGIYKQGDNEILTLAEQVRDIKEISDTRTIELVPPSFFKINVVFDHGGKFNDLSSGEKQQIFSINTIAYHIYNIASVMYDENSYKYNNINIVFDEVELYFHPEMQRTYISNLLHRISTLPLEDEIHNISLLFITHSPFILSDIPSSNILRLTVDKKTMKSLPAMHSEQTFGANIHDLLANDFFLECGFMGKFANDKIQALIKQIEAWKQSDNTSANSKIKDELYKTIQLIGEPLVKESLMDFYREKVGLHESEISIMDIDAEIARLQELKMKIQ